MNTVGATRERIDDWVVVGGGPHGVCAGRALVAAGATLRIVEPSGRLLERWTDRAASLEMAWMRSPVSSHLDAKLSALHHFAHRPENADVSTLAGPFRRPQHEVFMRHCREVIERHGLGKDVVTGRVESIDAERDHLRVRGEGVDVRARRVLVATGNNVPRVPDWARRVRREGAPVEHVFGGASALHHDLVGGGISAIQQALRVHRRTGRTVRLWMRDRLRVDEFDFDRDWAKHRFMSRWSGLAESERLAFLEQNPFEGSVPGGLAARLDRAVQRGSIEIEHGVPDAEWDAARGVLKLHGARRSVESDGVTLVTGFAPETVPAWLRASAERLDLPIVEGLPRLDEEMHWGCGVHVSGPLARLRLGPVAGLLVGARWATSRLPGVRMQPV